MMRQLLAGHGLLEAGRWYPGHGLVFSDMTRGGVFALADGGDRATTVIPHRKAIGGLVAHRGGGFVIAGRNVLHRWPGGEHRDVVLVEAAEDEQFFNDLTADRQGRLYVGSIGVDDPAGRRPGRLYAVDLDGRVAVLSDDVGTSNGLGTAPGDDALYHVDSERRRLLRYPIGEERPGRAELFVDTSAYPGVPDGLAVDDDGTVWVAMAGGSLVVGWSAKGALVAEVDVPQELVTSVCFGGHDGRTMFVLTGVNDEHPDPAGGCVYRRDAEIAGLPAAVTAVMPR